jgi:NADPH:quinone reductase-like Zn-dependent oxidoreductase
MHKDRAGWLKLNIGGVLPLAQAAQAHELLESRKTEGKLVLSFYTLQPRSSKT